MFVVFGVQTVKTRVKQGLDIRQHCAGCRFLSRMQEYRFREFFTLFFIPVFPVSKGRDMLVCERCGAGFSPQDRNCSRSDEDDRDDVLHVEGEKCSPGEKIVIECDCCGENLKVPIKPGRKLAVTCPHCGKEFDFKADRDFTA